MEDNCTSLCIIPVHQVNIVYRDLCIFVYKLIVVYSDVNKVIYIL